MAYVITNNKFMSAYKLLRVTAILEGISYLAFIITMPLKYQLGILWPNKIVGMGHGVLFLAYCALVFWVSTEYKMNLKQKFWAYAASLLPIATFIVDVKIFKSLVPMDEKK